MSEIRAIFEPGIWQNFSKEHRTLRKELETSLTAYQAGKFCDPMAVWGAFGAGKTQFLYWVAEHALEKGLIPVYCHLNDLLDRVPEYTGRLPRSRSRIRLQTGGNPAER